MAGPGCDCRRRHLGQSGCPVLERQPRRRGFPEIIAVQRFRRAPVEVRIVEKPCDRGQYSASRTGQRAAEIGFGTRLPAHPIVDQGVAGAGIEGEDMRILADPGHVRDAADVEHRDRFWQLGSQRRVKQRSQRRSLAAGGDVGGAEICDHLPAEPVRQRRAVADLPSPAARPGDAEWCVREIL